jgi:glycerol-3-phosphate acyltransferase PlsY
VAALAIGLAYLLGSIPTGLLLTRRVGVDVRRSGSGNIGATNVTRTAGVRLGLLTLAGDVLKGAVPCALALRFGAGDPLVAAVGAAAVTGHVFPVTLGFHGGKGVATALGALLALDPLVAGAAVAFFAIVVTIDRRVSVGSLAASALAPFGLALLGRPWPYVVAMIAVAVLIGLRHWENVVRILAGTEPRLGTPSA